MRVLVVLVSVAAAVASYIPVQSGYGHNQANKNYYDESSAKHDYTKGDYGSDASAYKDSSSGQFQGAHNLHHREQYTALKHNIDKDRKVINHKADDHKTAAYGHDYAQAAGGAYQSGGNQHSSDKGHEGKQVSHVNTHGVYGYGLGNNAHNAYDAGHKNTYGNKEYSNYGQYGAHNNHVAGTLAGGHALSSYVDHNEVLAREDEDYAFKDVQHEKDRHADYYNAHAAAANRGHSNTHYNQVSGKDSKQQVAKGHENTASQYGKGYSQVHDSANFAAGQAHQDHAAQYGGQHVNYNNAHQQYGAGYNLHDKDRNSYHTRTKKVHKEEHEVNHKDGKSQDSYWVGQHQQGLYGLHGGYQNAASSANRDYAYNQNHLTSLHHQPNYHHAIY